MITRKELDKQIHENSTKNHIELVRIANKELNKIAKEKYKMKVFLPNGKVYAELRASTIEKLEKSKHTFGIYNKDHVFTYGEIKSILIQIKKRK